MFRMAITKKSTNNKRWGGCGEKGTPLALLVGMQIDTATMENRIEIQLVWRTLWRYLKKKNKNKQTKNYE